MASNSIKRQRQKRRVDQDGDPEFQVAPMVDVLLVLMLFFMVITSTEVLKKERMQLPEANHAKKESKKRPNEIVVNVAWLQMQPVYTIDGGRLATADDVEKVLAARVQKNPQAYVLVRADQNVQYNSISDLMNACAHAGIGTVSFAALLAPGGPGKADSN